MMSVSLGQWVLAGAAGVRGPANPPPGLVTQVFTNVVYPILVLAVLGATIWIIKGLISRTKDAYQRARLYAAALLPLIILTFVRVTHPSQQSMLSASIDKPMLALLGAITGLVLVELGRVLMNSKAYLALPICAFSLSSLAVFILDSTMGNGLHGLEPFIFALVIVVALDVIVRDLPKSPAGPRSRPGPRTDTPPSSADLSGAPMT